MRYSIRIRYLSNKDNKWHVHKTKWVDSSNKAWTESETFQQERPDIMECACSIMHER